MSLGFALKEVGSCVESKAAFLRGSPRNMYDEAKQLEEYWHEIKRVVDGYLKTGFAK